MWVDVHSACHTASVKAIRFGVHNWLLKSVTASSSQLGLVQPSNHKALTQCDNTVRWLLRGLGACIDLAWLKSWYVLCKIHVACEGQVQAPRLIFDLGLWLSAVAHDWSTQLLLTFPWNATKCEICENEELTSRSGQKHKFHWQFSNFFHRNHQKQNRSDQPISWGG